MRYCTRSELREEEKFEIIVEIYCQMLEIRRLLSFLNVFFFKFMNECKCEYDNR